jgi:hypothetical protein
MPELSKPISRVISLIEMSLAIAPTGHQGAMVWTWVLTGLPVGQDPTAAQLRETLRAFAMIGEEFERAIEEVQRTTMPMAHASGTIEKVRMAFTPVHLMNGWNATVSTYLNPEVMGMLRMIEHFTPAYEVVLAPSDLAAFDAALGGLEEALAGLDLHDPLVFVLSEQVASMRRARADYAIAGAAAIRRATYALDGALLNASGVSSEGELNAQDATRDPAVNGAIGKALSLSTVSKKLLQVAGAISILGGAAEKAPKLIEGAASAVHAVRHALKAGEILGTTVERE